MHCPSDAPPPKKRGSYTPSKKVIEKQMGRAFYLSIAVWTLCLLYRNKAKIMEEASVFNLSIARNHNKSCALGGLLFCQIKLMTVLKA